MFKPKSVALQFLDEIEGLDVSSHVLHGIVVVCQFMHASVVDASVLYELELSRHNYVTPTSYLQLLSSYTDLMNKKKGTLMEGIGRLQTGQFRLSKGFQFASASIIFPRSIFVRLPFSPLK